MYNYLKGFVHASVILLGLSFAGGYYATKENNIALRKKIRRLEAGQNSNV